MAALVLHTTEGRATGDMEDFSSFTIPRGTPPPMTKNTIVQGMMELFDDLLDKNPKDESLTQEEFEKGGRGFTLDWEQVVKLTDNNCDGAISKEEFLLMGDMSWEIVALDKNGDFFISKEELGDDETWKTLLKYQQINPSDQEPAISMEDYSIFLAEKMIESAVPCGSPIPVHREATRIGMGSPSLAPAGPLSQQMEMLFDVDEGGNEPGDALDRIVVYRVRVAGRTLYYRGRAERINSMED